MHYSRSSFVVVVVVVVVLVVLLYIVAIAVSSRQCASGSPGASSPSGPPLPPPLCLRYSRFEPNTFDPSGPVTLIAFVFSPSVASTSYSTFSLSRKLRNPSAFKCDWWTKISSLPSSGMINPNPLLALNHLTVFYFILESRERDRDGREKEDDVSDRSDF